MNYEGADVFQRKVFGTIKYMAHLIHYHTNLRVRTSLFHSPSITKLTYPLKQISHVGPNTLEPYLVAFVHWLFWQVTDVEPLWYALAVLDISCVLDIASECLELILVGGNKEWSVWITADVGRHDPCILDHSQRREYFLWSLSIVLYLDLYIFVDFLIKALLDTSSSNH